MKRYIDLLKNYALVQLTFRTELWLWFILESLPLLMLLFIWSSIYDEKVIIQGFTFSQMVFYYLVSSLMKVMTGSYFEEWRVDEIREGKVDRYLLKPPGYIHHILTGFLASKFIFTVLNLPFFIGFAFICTRLFHVTLPTLSFQNLLPMVTLIFFSLMLNFCLSLLIVLLGFWLENAEALQHFSWFIVALLSGAIIPLTLMPEQLQSISNALPFKYLVAIPAMVALNKYTLVPSDYWSMLLTLSLSFTFLYFLWQKAKFKYSSVGG